MTNMAISKKTGRVLHNVITRTNKMNGQKQYFGHCPKDGINRTINTSEGYLIKEMAPGRFYAFDGDQLMCRDIDLDALAARLEDCQ